MVTGYHDGQKSKLLLATGTISPPSPVGNAFVGSPNDPNSSTLATAAARPAADGIAEEEKNQGRGLDGVKSVENKTHKCMPRQPPVASLRGGGPEKQKDHWNPV